MDEISNYYPSIDKNILDNYCKNCDLKNLIHLSTKTELPIFNKKNKRWQLKSKDKLLKECEKIKKKELKTTTTMLSNLAKLSICNTNDIKKICNKLENKIINIDEMVTCINLLEDNSIFIPEKKSINLNLSNYSSSDSFIELYSNC